MNSHELEYLRRLKRQYDEDGIYSETPQSEVDRIMANLEKLRIYEASQSNPGGNAK